MKQLIPLLLILALVACKSKTEEVAEDVAPSTTEITLTDEQFKSFKIELGSVNNQQVTDNVELNGSIDILPQQRASVSFPVAAYVRSVAVVPGSYVRKGQSLAVLSSMELLQIQQDYAQNVAQMQMHEQEVARQRTLVGEDVGAKRHLQEAEAALNTSKAILAGLKSKLDLVGLNSSKPSSVVSVISPISGSVQSVGVSVGKATNTGDVLFEIVNTDQPIVKLKVFEKDLVKISVGERFDMVINGQKISGNINHIGQTFSQTDRTVEVFGKLNQKPQRVVIGQYVTARIGTGQRTATVLPESAVAHEGEVASIFVQKADKTFVKETVKLGIEQGGMIEIISEKALPAGKIVIKGANLLAAQMSGGGEEE